MSDARTNMLRLISGFQASQAISVAAAIGLADKLSSGPINAIDLAPKLGAHPVALQRLMRALAAIGVLRSVGNDAFILTAMGEFLKTDAKGTCAPMAELFGRQNVWHAWGNLRHAVLTGSTAFDHVHHCSVWEYRSRHPQEADVFDRAMASGSAQFAKSVLDVCDFERFRHVVDVGGGDGVFLAEILERHPHVHGTLFDQPNVVARAMALHKGNAFAGRYRTSGGNFFDAVPPGGDAYLLKWILHDWSDTAAVDILKSCRRAMSPTGRLLVAEYVLGPGFASPEGEFMDLTMMVMNGGRERTVDEFASLFQEAGFKLLSVTRTATPLCLLEGAIA